METKEQEIMTVSMSSSSLEMVQRLWVQVNWLFRLGIFVGFLHVALNLGYFFLFTSRSVSTRTFSYWSGHLGIWVELSFVILFVVQINYYRTFLSKMKQGMETLDNVSFNDSFEYLLRSNRLAIISAAISAFYVILSFGTMIELYKKVMHH